MFRPRQQLALLRLAARMQAIDRMDPGPAKRRALDDFLAQAERSGEPLLVVGTYLEAYVNAYNSGMWDTGVTPFVSLLGTFLRHRQELPGFVDRRVLAALETGPEVLVATVTTPGPQLERAIDDIASLLRAEGRSDIVVELARAQWAEQRGDAAGALDHLDRYRDGGGIDDAPAAVETAHLLRRLGHADEGEDLLARYDDGELARALVRGRAGLVRAEAAVQRGDADGALDVLDAVASDWDDGPGIEGWRRADACEAASLYARLGAPEQGRAIAGRMLAVADDEAVSLLDRMVLCAHAAAVVADPDEAARAHDAALAVADRFDARNGSDAQRRWVDGASRGG